MGMTIEKAMNNLNGILTEATEGENSVCYVTENDAETLQVAIDTMRKYKKIQKIARWNNAPSPYYKPDGQLFREIIEVLEDGKID